MAVDASSISSADAQAIIDSALADAQSGDSSDAKGTPGNPLLLPSGDTADPKAPPPPELTPEQKKDLKEQEKIRKAKEDLLGKEQADALAKEEAEQAAREATLIGLAEKALNAGKSKANDASIKVGNVPTPGSIATPLILLCIFFFILISYNGNTRLKWLWLVLTNNAYISPSAGVASQSSQGTGSGPGYIPAGMPMEIPLPKYSSSGMGSPF